MLLHNFRKSEGDYYENSQQPAHCTNFPTDNLSIIDFSLQNTGNIVIKNQEVRFTLESKSEFIDGFFEPIPEPEWKVEEMNQLDK